jgi:hypothetical protein
MLLWGLIRRKERVAMLLLLLLRLVDVWPCLRLERRRGCGRGWSVVVLVLELLLCGADVDAQALQSLCVEGRVPAQRIEPRVVHPQRVARAMARPWSAWASQCPVTGRR